MKRFARYWRRSGIIAATFLVGITFAQSVYGLAVPTAPPLERPIVDQTNTLNAAQIDSLAKTINDGRTQKDYQLAVLMIPTLEDRDIESYSLDVARTWGVGTANKDNGVLLLVAKNDRQLRIEVGNGLEGDLTDAESGRIIRNVITPRFKEANYYEGIARGVESIQAQVEGKTDPNAAQDVPAFDVESIFYVFLAAAAGLSWLASILARTKSWWAGGVVGGGIGLILAAVGGWTVLLGILAAVFIVIGLLFDWVVSRNFRQRASEGLSPSWWAGGSTLGGGGGGGFGGGGFSGGGSSGSW